MKKGLIFPPANSMVRSDPLGSAIALIFLTIFLLSVLTLCLRVCSNICADSRRCCTVQCAISVQCCCEWKAGRLRIIPGPSEAIDHPEYTQQRPEPPPSYIDIFPTPEGTSEEGPPNSPSPSPTPSESDETRLNRPSTGCWFVNLGPRPPILPAIPRRRDPAAVDQNAIEIT